MSYADPYTSAPQNYETPQPLEQQAPIERHESNYGQWMAPAAGGAAGAALATETIRRHQMEQQERAQQQELDQQAQLQNQSQHYPTEQTPVGGPVGAAPAVPERDPDHHAPTQFIDVGKAHDNPSLIPVPIAAAGSSREPTGSHLDNTNISSPTTTNPSFLDDSEVGSAVPASGKTINGGPVPVGLVDLADAHAQAHPGMHRTNTDISVSDLHVPGEYPKGGAGATAASKLPPPVTEESVIQM